MKNNKIVRHEQFIFSKEQHFQTLLNKEMKYMLLECATVSSIAQLTGQIEGTGHLWLQLSKTNLLTWLNICIKKQTCENLSSIGCQSCEKIMKEKTPLSHKLCAFRCLEFETSVEVIFKFKYFSEKLFLSESYKCTLLQWVSFLKMFHTVNSSPLLITK